MGYLKYGLSKANTWGYMRATLSVTNIYLRTYLSYMGYLKVI
jgi:hypothetical protein